MLAASIEEKWNTINRKVNAMRINMNKFFVSKTKGLAALRK